MRVALVYDRINKWGGAERVLLTLCKIFPLAPIFTLVHSSGSAPWAKKIIVYPSFFNYVPFLRRRHEILAPFAQMGFESHIFDDYDIVISLSSEHAKSVITKPSTLHICYCLTPTRYLWSGKRDYEKKFIYRVLPAGVKNYLKFADLVSSSRPDVYLAISNTVKNRIKSYYGKNAQVIYPPIENTKYSKSSKYKKSDHYLMVSRLVPYKKHDLVIKAFNHSGRQLTIIGTGAEEKKLKKLSHSNIIFKKNLSQANLIREYSFAKALIFPQEEDFGLVSLEAQACGTPVIAFVKGGATESVVNNQTGILFSKQNINSLNRAINLFESGKHQITSQKCIQNAQKFNEEHFCETFSAKVKSLWAWHKRKMSM